MSGHWRTMTRRHMPWRPKQGEKSGSTRPDMAYVNTLPDPLSESRSPRWGVPGPLASVITDEFGERWQAWCLADDGIVCVSEHGAVTTWSRADYEAAVQAAAGMTQETML